MNKKDLKIVFFGTPDFAVESLKRLVEGNYNIAAVVTATDKPAGRGHHMLQSAVKEYALSQDIPVLQPESLKDPAFTSLLQAIGADLFIVIAFRMLPQVVWQMPRLGTFNLHGSLLPKYRGAAPINRAVINGEKETGVTTFFLKHEIDTGDIIDQVAIPIGDNENVGSVYDRLMKIGADLTVSTVDRILAGNLTATPQDRISTVKPSPAPKIFKETCHIDWTKTATEIHNLVRGLSPYPGAWTRLVIDDNGSAMDIKIFETRLNADVSTTKAGTIAVDGDKLFVVCGDGHLIEILQLQPSGKKRMSTADYLRGAKKSDYHFE